MLQQILTDMYIEPELLAELNEEQKQVLFFKMREEQVRRWKEREARLEKEETAVRKPKKAGGKTVSWMQGSDNDVWVWVMGEHPNDKSYDQICDEIMAERAALQAQREAEELRAKKEAELEKRFSSIYLDPEVLALTDEEQRQEKARQEQAQKEAERQEQERQEQLRLDQERQERAKQEQARQEEQKQEQARQAAALEELKRREAEERRKAEEELRRLEEERARQIYMDLKKVQNHEKEDKEWQETLRKSKVADLRRRSLAKQTREDHKRRSLKALESGRVAAMTKAFGGEKPTAPPKPKPRNLTLTSDLIQKPGVCRSLSTSSREQIICWFRDEQLPLRAGFQKDQSRIAPWFHGIITREEAETLLSEKGPGHFLVRVSEKIRGYVISYRCQDGFKHFLIDATENCYMLLGDQLKFATLAELVEYHEEEPITSLGGECLRHACGQKQGCVDYADLFT
ncbi:SH2 domain-containing protein 4A [Chanos chanos]|uniref:SH2 domain-containing protein 4A n=1 Tax=Chanos chanos TaxID=29144 RepID=A0A6J2UZP4_CHACN|nr:SH2 domain-containing protein 4A [Chanos chanos]XP_030624977.1 SH2 domain-containing protein 4A [Chanos chanos]